jgi:putative transport protein
MPETRGVFLRKITRGATATDIPILPTTTINRGDLFTIVGRTQDTTKAIKVLGVADRPTDVTDMAFVGAFVVIGALFGSLVLNIGGVPLTLSTAGGALIAGIIGGWLRSVRPSFGRIPTPTIWFMNSVGLNIFIAIVGISAGPGFVNGLKTQGVGLFLWGALATTVPLILGMLIAKFVFRFHDALTLGIVSGSRTTTASLGLVCDQAKSQVPALGYTVTTAGRQHAADDLGHGPDHSAVVNGTLTNHDVGGKAMEHLDSRQYEKLGPFETQGLRGQGGNEGGGGSSLISSMRTRGNPN